MQQFRLFFTILFLLASLFVFIFLAIFDISVFNVAVDVIKKNLWVAGTAVIIFLVLLSSGVVSNLESIKRSLIRNGYFQLAILELFLASAGLAYIRYYIQQPGQIVFQLHSNSTKDYVYLGVNYQGSGVSSRDTVRAPGKLVKRPPGKYHIETLDQDIVNFHADVILTPAEVETLLIPVTLNSRTLTVRSEPPGADIWLNGVQATQTPDSFKILTGDTVILQLKMKGYQAYNDTIHLNENMNLGVIPMRKLFTVWISSRYEDVKYNIYDTDGTIVFSSYGSRKVQLAQGNYRLSYEIGEGQYETKSFLLNYNMTVMIP
jgi:hypothetical protein